MTIDPQELASVPLFASLSEDERRSLAGRFEDRSVRPGARLCGEGASGYCFFVLTDGSADVTIAGEVVRSLGPGDFFGEVAMLDGGRRTATVTASSEAKVLVLFGSEFRRLQEEQPETAASIEAVMRERVPSLLDLEDDVTSPSLLGRLPIVLSTSTRKRRLLRTPRLRR